jgi:hypothetical protein
MEKILIIDASGAHGRRCCNGSVSRCPGGVSDGRRENFSAMRMTNLGAWVSDCGDCLRRPCHRLPRSS